MLDTIRVRCAEMRDREPVFELSNDPVARANDNAVNIAARLVNLPSGVR